MATPNTLNDWLNWQQSLHPSSIDLGLSRVVKVFKTLHPNWQPIPTITVGGTNGKGSSIAFLQAIYQAQGLRVGAYTSPHLLAYNERISVAGVAASDQQICQSFAAIEEVRGDISLSYFEFGTLAALDIFAHSFCQVLLLEVGLGGRLDAVNIIDADLALITSIGIDHTDWLGNTRESIGFEKAGIFRATTPAVIGDLDPPIALLDYASKLQTPLFCAGKQFDYQLGNNGWDWHCQIAGNDWTYSELPPPTLKGSQQYENAAAALMAITLLQDTIAVGEAAIYRGLQNAKLNGRLQLIDGKIPVLLDVAHNVSAVVALFAHLRDAFAGQKIYAIFSMLQDKDISGVISTMSPIISHWYFAPLDTPRAVSRDICKKHFTKCGAQNVSYTSRCPISAYRAAKNHAEHGDLLLVFGSFFLVSQLLEQFEQQ